MLTIPSTTVVGNSVCRGITVTDDMVVEESETFNITVETSDSNDIITGPSTATFTIIDNDSKYNQQPALLTCNIDDSTTATNFSGNMCNSQYTSCLHCVFSSFSGATVSIQETEISIAEGTDGQICIVLENAAGGLERDVSVTLINTTGTAGDCTDRIV